MLNRLVVVIWYWACTIAMRIALGIFTRRTVRGASNCPRSGPLIVVANHLSGKDPPFIAAALPRRIRFMAKIELFAKRPVSWHVRAYGAYPVRRFEGDLGALRHSLDLLGRGSVIGVFPEGTRSKDLQMHTGYSGVGLIALRSGAPVLPIAVWGTENLNGWRRLLRRPTTNCVGGEPIRLEAVERVRTPDAHAATERIMRAIAALLPPSYRGVYAEESVETPTGTADQR